MFSNLPRLVLKAFGEEVDYVSASDGARRIRGDFRAPAPIPPP
ncbi:MAG: hypothetical protein FD149_2200 [Rhodospirillaceae bacterium]|nr:MAG: hypothetical protein FD149_2200 [Rhodospirillaceae bacterium]